MGNSNIATQKQDKYINQRKDLVKNSSAFSNLMKGIQKQELFDGKYILLTHISHKIIGNSMLAKKLPGEEYLVIKKLHFDCGQQYRIQLQHLLKKKGLYQQNQNLLKIIDIVQQSSNQKGKRQLVLNLVTQNFDMSLKQVFQNRIVSKKTFNQKQITKLLITAIKGYSLIQSSGSKNSKINMDTILAKEGEDLTLSFKVIDGHLIDLKTNYQLNKTFSIFSSSVQTIFLSPEQFIAFVSHSNETIVDEKSGVFSLGATILSLCLMMSVKLIYNNISKFIDGRLLASLIKIAGSRYGDFIGDMLSAMLELNQQRRPNFASLLTIMLSKLSEYKRSIFLPQGLTQKRLLQLSIYEQKMRRSTCSSELSLKKKQASQCSQVDWGLLIFEQSHKLQGQNVQKIQALNEESIPSLSYQSKSQLLDDQISYLSKTEKNDIYEGQSKNGQPNGWGTLFYYNPPKIMDLLSFSYRKLPFGVQNLVIAKYEGQFKQGVFWGVGRLQCQAEVILQGFFVNGKVKYPEQLVKLTKIDKCVLKQ